MPGMINSPALMAVDENTLRQPHPVGDGYGQLVQAIRPLPVKGSTVTVRVTVPGVVGGAYAANDQVGATFAIPGAVRTPGGGGRVSCVQLLETTTQQIAADVVFLSEGVTASADNAAASISDANMADKYLGFVKITDYISVAAGAVGRTIDGFDFNCADNETAIYGLLITRGAPTYGAGGLTLLVTIIQD